MATLLFQGHASCRITTRAGAVIYIDPFAGEGYDLPADLVLIAAGFWGGEEYVAQAFGVERDGRTNVATQSGGYETSVERVFTAGDMHRGQSLVVWAIAEGRQAAKEADDWLSTL